MNPLDSLQEFLGAAEGWLWTWAGMPVVVVLGLYFTIRTGAVQLRMIPAMLGAILQKPQREQVGRGRDRTERAKSLSAFQAFSVSAAARVGTGNISGVAGAIFLGGPGAVLWMWVMCLFAGAASFIESTLAQLWKSRADDTYKGGPAFYIHRGLGSRGFGAFFAVLFIFCFAFAFTSLQANTIVDAVTGAVAVYADPEGLAWLPVVLGLLLAVLTAAIIFGGMRRVAVVAQNMVPVMALVYLVLGIVIVGLNLGELPRVVGQIVGEAFTPQAAIGGGFGAVIVNGVQRGMLSNEAGMGSVPNVAATASVSHPVKQGLVQTFGVYFDTLLICSITAFIVLVSFPDVSVGGEGLVMVQESLASTLGPWAAVLLGVIMFLLAFTSVLGNFSYGEANMHFLTSKRGWHLAFGAAVVALVFLGSVIAVDLAWTIAGVSMVFIALINLVVIAILTPTALKLLRHYNAQRAQGLDPIFLASDLPEIKNVEVWEDEDVCDYHDEREAVSTGS
ncbi:alanine/glycine:cation symporter family protein [Brachybacterium saurashtrense]|uniref:Alanine:cation symporter family protein n=1 Tax=Brachybacterium saurashtrense TaxID=556288 RepID=A0A345YPP3_9MICO|nr:alanine/glycine:cation symporter family protein [Brachybacterium saurashtrense]AXK45895.1 alanine:cation symporter family protein [Brachybacterium saurashtrense]RRR24914.1 alanine:cation symporter family protein [Brachybacterium saurashtrense]